MLNIAKHAGSISGLLVSGSVLAASNGSAQVLPTERSLSPATAVSSEGFTSVTSIRELSDGRTFVADRGERHLYLVDWAAGTIDQILRQGEGPGEYRAIGWLYAVGDDKTLLTDYARQRWILLRDTDVLETYVGTNPLNDRFRANLDGVAASGAVLGSVSAERPGFGNADVRVLELAPGLGPYENLPELDTIARMKGNGRLQLACAMAISRTEPVCHFLEAEGQALLFPDGWIAIALQNPYRTSWRTPDGRMIQGEPLPGDSVFISQAEKCAAVNGWGERTINCDSATLDGFVWPESIPPFLSGSRVCPACGKLAAGSAFWLFADPRGRLVIRRTPHRSQTDNLYDIVDRRGRLVDRLILPRNEAIVGFGASNVYTVRVDENDLQWLQRHPWIDRPDG